MISKSRLMQCLMLVTFLASLLSGCLPAADSAQSSLLGQDYLTMTDAQLIAYEQQLSDELVLASSSTNRDVSVGFGFGSWSGNTGYGVRTDRWLGDRNDAAIQALSSRREAVRAEMRRRQLLPW
jgi:hypothetical protein